MTKTINERAEELMDSINGEVQSWWRTDAARAAILEALREQAREDARIAKAELVELDWNNNGSYGNRVSAAILAQLQQGGGNAAQKGGGGGE